MITRDKVMVMSEEDLGLCKENKFRNARTVNRIYYLVYKCTEKKSRTDNIESFKDVTISN